MLLKGGMNKLKKAVHNKEIIFEFVGNAFVLCSFAYLHRLTLWYILFIFIACVFALPCNVYAAQKRNIEKKRFDELCLYLKHIVLNYKISGKILVSLENTLQIFHEHSHMYKCIKKAIQSMKEGKEFEQSLLYIEKDYENFYVSTVHEFMLLGEQEVGTSVNYSLSQINIKQWQQRVELLEDTKYKIKTRCKYFVLGSLLLSYYIMIQLDHYLYLLDTYAPYKIVTFLYFIAMSGVYVISKLMLSGKWIEEE